VSTRGGAPSGRARWSSWRIVTFFGLVSLAGDLVYEGARSITGPYLASLGASALLVGIVTGVGEGAALVLRLVFGPMADRSGAYWGLATAGYAMTAICVPLMAVAPYAGGAGLVLASAMVLGERVGKAVRSPAKSTLLAHSAKELGRGRGFAVHKALDQVGAFGGPLIVAGVAAWTGHLWWGLAVLAIPGALSLVLLGVLRQHAPAPEPPPAHTEPADLKLGRDFHLFALSCAASTLGLMTFGVIGFHLADAGLLSAAMVPIAYAGAMLVEAVAALVTGFAFDKYGGAVLLVLPPMISFVPALSLSSTLVLAMVGLALWGIATGVQDSTVKALVADLAPAGRTATAYGVFAAWQGAAAIAGGALAGWLFRSPALSVVVVTTQVIAFVLLVVVLRRTQRPARLDA
jgi:MFS family permease